MNTSQLNEIRAKMQVSLDFFQQELNAIRTGRASTSLVDNLIVNAYGGQIMKLRELGNIGVSDARTIVIEVWDTTVIPDVEKAISQSLNLSCQIHENTIRIILPSLTEERRKEFVKILHQKAEMGKIAIRQIRGDVMRDFKKSFEAKELNEDEKKRGEKELQDLTDEFVEKIENTAKKKEEEIMTL